MKIIYFCQAGKYGALAAAGLHLRVIHENITYQDLLSFFQSYKHPLYIPFFIGKDAEGASVYALGVMKEKELVKKIIASFKNTFCSNREPLIVIDALPKLKFPLNLLIPLFSTRLFKKLGDVFLPFLIWQNISIIRSQVYNHELDYRDLIMDNNEDEKGWINCQR